MKSYLYEPFEVNELFKSIMAKKSRKYWSYVEETPKHHKLIKRLASVSGSQAISKSKDNNVEVTYLIGTTIILEEPQGQKKELGEISNLPRKVKVGTVEKLSKRT